MDEDKIIALDYKSNIDLFQFNAPTDFIVKLTSPLVLDDRWWIAIGQAYVISNSDCLVSVMCDLCNESFHYGKKRPTVGDLLLKKRTAMQQINIPSSCYYKARDGETSYMRITLTTDASKLLVKDFKVILRLTRK